MNKNTIRGFAIFWVLAGVIWTIAAIRHGLVYPSDTTGLFIYAVTAVISFFLAFVYYKKFNQ